ncbi:hypothetical protein EB796_011649 [Bugula neritina]|uniref:Uncharacterized protein n=1 Tax=Bugula neritina TaxID=10212 RepID=A0A7J7JUL3_BUGNE|nr:hypothetical protein EB796_011649 [Bugula neritina]
MLSYTSCVSTTSFYNTLPSELLYYLHKPAYKILRHWGFPFEYSVQPLVLYLDLCKLVRHHIPLGSKIPSCFISQTSVSSSDYHYPPGHLQRYQQNLRECSLQQGTSICCVSRRVNTLEKRLRARCLLTE